MQKAAKEKTFLLLAIMSALLLCAPSFASSIDVLTSKTRAELFLLEAQNRVGSEAFNAAKHVENYDPSWGTASESSVAPNRGPRINVKHLFHGEINKGGKAVGFHHAGSIGHQGKARISSIVDPANAQGVYRAKVEVFNEATGKWVAKGPASTFFPDAWSRAQVLSEVRGAFGNQLPRAPHWAPNYFEGLSPSGVRIGGYLDNLGNINTSFPIY